MVCYVLLPTECLSRAPATSMFDLQAEAATAYADRDFSAATQKLNELVENEPNSSRWHEMRAQVLVDGKNFKAAVDDFDAALQEVPGIMLSGCPGHCSAGLGCCTVFRFPVTWARVLSATTAVALASGVLIAGLGCCQLHLIAALRGTLTRRSRQTRLILTACVWWAAGSKCLTRVGLTTACCRVFALLLCSAVLLCSAAPEQASAAAMPA